MQKKLGHTELIKLYFTMLRIRRAQEKIAEIYPQTPRRIQCPVHLCIGQEAIPAGVCASLRKDDFAFSFYRGHGHYLAKGGDLKALFAELYGKVTGCSKGHGGSMHIIDTKVGFMGTSAIVGGQIPMAVGSALAFKLMKTDRVSVVFFGDGATEEGVFHEALNFASLKKLPVLFVCENNFYAVKAPLSARQPRDNIFERARSYGMPGIRINGNKVMDVYNRCQRAIDSCRRGGGPTLIECRTYRWRGHLENTFFSTDVLDGRSQEEMELWKARCPIKSFEQFLLSNRVLSLLDFEFILKDIDTEIAEAVQYAENSSFPEAGNGGEKCGH
ncbi:MAG: Dehydrogenase E1 component [Candidatus Beckwithbacteria bacterium GW2011_GWA2_43_10]|uniref:Dehydrogenase E1 component n=1 Tax=Candidatus Beckwithbacteria bacterium GW2011_GWA2_43_10 TaxID=1618369 RepID=A0A0G1E6G4_9BACT|nr:MAG: Dehydrogenase E1 component [Candidatus Beckwithbacteria bacterium GW2011_GWA2_43_10]